MLIDLMGIFSKSPIDEREVEMKKKKLVGVTALVPLALFNSTVLPAYAENTEYQETGMEAESAECQVIYKSTYDFSEDIPKYPELEVSASGYDGVYDGKPHGITVGCKNNGATILYSTDGKTYTEKNPVYTNVGTYVTYYKVEKDGYTTAAGQATVKIAEAKIDYILKEYSGVYDGKPHSIDLSVKTDGCRVLYSGDGINFTEKKPEYTGVGTHVIYYQIEKEGYTTVTGQAAIKITDGRIDYTLHEYNGPYDGRPHSIDLSVKTDGCKVLYSVDGINFTEKKPEYKEPGTYTVYYKIIKDNYETVEGNSQIIIREKDNGIKLSDTSGTVKVDESIKFTVDTGGEPFDVAVSDSSIAKVTVKDGVVTVTGLKEGKTTITISCNGKTAKYEVTVVDTDIKLSDTSGTVKVDDSIKFTVDTGGEPFDVAVSDPSIAKITVKDGVVTVTGLKAGTATITITSNGKRATYKVTVTDADIKLSDTKGTVKVDESTQFTVDTGGKAFDVTISDSSIAKVTVKDGIVTVTGLKVGTATITVTSNGKSATYKITVVGTENGNPDKISNVQTGDESNFLLYGAIAIASAFGLAKNKSRKEKRKL